MADSAYGRIYRVGRANFNPSRPTIQKYQNFFVQDSWKVGSRVTINPGLRYEQEKLGGTIITDWTLKNNWAPRVGAAYDMTGDGKAKVFGSFGLFYARIPNDLASRALSADDGIARADYFDANLTQAIPNGVLAGGVTNHFVIAGVGADVIDPDAKLSYVREFVLGVEREILTNTTFSVRWINRRIPRVLEDIANVPMAAYDLGVPGVGSVEYILGQVDAADPSEITSGVRPLTVRDASPVPAKRPLLPASAEPVAHNEDQDSRRPGPGCASPMDSPPGIRGLCDFRHRTRPSRPAWRLATSSRG